MSTNEELLKTIQNLDGEQIKTLLTALLSNNQPIRGQTENTIILDEFDTPAPKKRGRPKKNTEVVEPQPQPQSTRRANGSIQLGRRPNNFESMGLSKQCLEDSKIDQVLNKNNLKRERETRPQYEKISAECLGCGKKENLDKNLVWTDIETKKVVYRCNSCNRSR